VYAKSRWNFSPRTGLHLLQEIQELIPELLQKRRELDITQANSLIGEAGEIFANVPRSVSSFSSFCSYVS
jgi:hypothetical protein